MRRYTPGLESALRKREQSRRLVADRANIGAAKVRPCFAASTAQIDDDDIGAPQCDDGLWDAALASRRQRRSAPRSARAADCGDSAEGFNEWLASFKQVAVRDGVSPQVVDSALNGVVYDPSVSAHDRGQGFGQNFAAFAARHITPS